ncbi:MAG: SPASM domain-containing protein [Longicatena sp.]
MKNRTFLIKPVSSNCNLMCKYCFYVDVSEHREIKSNGIMTYETMQLLIDKALRETEHIIAFAFQGGEPTLAGLSYFEAFVQYVETNKKSTQRVSYSIQTNGILLDDAWCSFFHKYNFLIGISLDGYQENHDYFRMTASKSPTYKSVMKSIAVLRKYEVEFNILTVLSAQLAKHPEKLYNFYKEQNFSYIQLIPCLSGLDEKRNEYSLTPKLFASFYKLFYDLWLEDYKKGRYLSVTLFDNIIPLFIGIPPYQCGTLGQCNPQLVVESNGGVYPCDFYVLDKYYGGNIKSMELDTIENCSAFSIFKEEGKTTKRLCSLCEFRKICNGNCKRINSVFLEENYCGYQDFLQHAASSMSQIAKKI